MKSFRQYIQETHDENESWTDPAEWLPAYHDDWCKRNPNHKDCEEWRKKQKKKEGKK